MDSQMMEWSDMGIKRIMTLRDVAGELGNKSEQLGNFSREVKFFF